MKIHGKMFIVTVVLLAMFAHSLWAAPVTPEQVHTAAETFIALRYPVARGAVAHTVTAIGSSHLAVEEVEPWTASGILLGFIAHLSPSGYVLMRADDLAPPIKLYIDEGDFSELSPDFQEVLKEELSLELEAVDELTNNGAVGGSEFQQQWAALLNPQTAPTTPPNVGGTPLLTTTWSQGDPYNYYAPAASGGPSYADGRAVTGCVATALAQILRYHQWPNAIGSNHTYTDSSGACQGTHSASDAGLGNYDWANMPTSASSSSPLAQQRAIGQLLYHVGVTVHMNYEAGGSGAYSSRVVTALRNSFSYDSGNLESRSGYSNSAWYNKIAADINDQKPIYYSFRDHSRGAGHAVVCDGARNGNEIHINMGWGSYCDAWYNMDSVNTDNNYHFNDGHQAIFGITPIGAATYTITASAGTGGQIDPSGTVSVSQGSSQGFTITPTTGYQIEDVVVDGMSQGRVSSYTFPNVQANHTIHATFEEIPVVTYTIEATAGAHGQITPSGTITVNQGVSRTFTIAPETGYLVKDVLVDGKSKGRLLSYAFSNIQANHTIHAEFEAIPIQTYVIEATAGAHGQISPAGTITVNEGNNQQFTMTAESGYEIEDVVVDGVSNGALASYTFTNIVANHTITVSFKAASGNGHSYFGFDDFGGNWHDAEKSLSNPDDDWMCWAAAAANILDWAEWDTLLFDSELDIFYNFQEYWTDVAGLMDRGWQWWFDGTEPDDPADWARVEKTGGGNHWADYNFFDYFYDDWARESSGQWMDDGLGLMETVDQYLHSGYGTTLAVYTEDAGHALTAWGYEYNDAGDYTGVWVTDSDDYTAQMKLLSVEQDLNGIWYLGDEYEGWHIGGVQALDRHDAVPEPGTLLLLGCGLFGLLAFRRRRQ